MTQQLNFNTEKTDLTITPAVMAIVQEKGTEQLFKIQKFVALLNREPDKNSIANRESYSYIPISHLENSLDELFFGQWETTNFKWERMFNEVVGSIELKVLNPVTNQWLTRTGAGSIVIMQDANTTIGQFNEHKKKNALEMGFPKLKAECVKNAIIGLGKFFGRDINRKNPDKYEPLIKDDPLYPQQVRALVNTAKNNADVNDLWELYPDLHGNPIFVSDILRRKKELTNGLQSTN